jgi:DNA-binding response OmpR family regulator
MFPERYVFGADEAKTSLRMQLVNQMKTNDTVVEYSAVTGATSHRRRILIIDDDMDQASAIAFGLEQQNFEPLVAATAAEGMIAVGLYHPDLIIVDICLPDRNGLDLCAEISDGSETTDIPVIVLSAVDGKDIVRRARAVGCRFFVRKPYDPNALLTLINESLGPSGW